LIDYNLNLKYYVVVVVVDMDHLDNEYYQQQENVVLDHEFVVLEMVKHLVDIHIVVEQVEVVELVDEH
jgi:hypothetical protein